eukprot:4721488-Ditylum_brightwellii.AAC.1
MAIEEHSLNYQETRYEMCIISNSIRAMLNTKQRDNESPQDFTMIFKTSKDVTESRLGGPLFIKKVVENMDECDESNPDDIDKLFKQVSDQWIASVYMENSDQHKYGSILKI